MGPEHSQHGPEDMGVTPPSPDPFGRTREQEPETFVKDENLARDMADAIAPGMDKAREIEKAGSDVVENRQRVLDEYSGRFWPGGLIGHHSDIEFPADNPPIKKQDVIFARVYCDLARRHAEEIVWDQSLPSDDKYKLLDGIQPGMSGALRGDPAATDLQFYDSVAKGMGGRLEIHHVPQLLGRIIGFLATSKAVNEQTLNTMIDALGRRYSQDRAEGRARVLDILAPEIVMMRQVPEGFFASKHDLYDRLMAESDRKRNPQTGRYELKLEI
ncbi:MAG: hypothetical protein OEV37_01915 [Candidatus Berkelbacteria bacterium]|nr:hypothetical protein [Candidatus Berkelbacteria bacterium]